MLNLYLDKKRDLTKLKAQSITLFPSRKMGCSVVTESPLEASFCYYLEFDDVIERYESQPLGYYFQFKNNTHVFTPDFEVFHKNKSYYYEIQSNIQGNKQDNYEDYFNAAKNQAKNLQKDLVLVKEDWIRKSPYFQNIVQLYRCMSVKYTYEFLIRVKETMKDVDERAIFELMEDHSELAFIYKLIAEKRLGFDLTTQLLGLDCKVTWGQHD